MEPGAFDRSQLLQLLQSLSCLPFPATKDQVVSLAESKGAPQELVEALRSSSLEYFNSSSEVLNYLVGSTGVWSLPQELIEDAFPGDWTGGGPDDL